MMTWVDEKKRSEGLKESCAGSCVFAPLALSSAQAGSAVRRATDAAAAAVKHLAATVKGWPASSASLPARATTEMARRPPVPVVEGICFVVVLETTLSRVRLKDRFVATERAARAQRRVLVSCVTSSRSAAG